MTQQVNPKISIVMPTYNGSKYIRQSIDSCLRQTYDNIELIIVDDCSKDETPAIIKSYSDPRIKYIRNETNQRLPRSLNIGFKHAQGEFMTWTSDDNYFAPTAIEEMYNRLKEEQGDFVYCDLYNVYVNEQDKIKARLLEDDHRIKIEDCVGACFLYSRKVLETVGDYNPDAELVEDYDYWIRVSLKFKLHHIKKPLYYYRYHDLSLWGTRYAQIQIMEYLLKFNYDFLTPEETNWALRGLKLKAKNNFSPIHKMINRFFFKAPIQQVLQKFKNGQLTYREARAELSSLIYGRPDDAKHFVFIRKFAPEWDWGGTENVLMDWFSRINFGSCRVSLIVPLGSKQIFEQKMADKPWKVNVVEMPFSLRTGACQRFRLMFQFLRDIKPDKVIFVHGWYADFRAAEFFAAWFISKRQVYLHENGFPPLLENSVSKNPCVKGPGLWMIFQRFFASFKSTFCRSIFVVSGGVKERLVNYWGYPRNKISIISHGVDVKRYYPSTEDRLSLRKIWNIKDTTLVVFMSARLAQEKRIDLAIDAFELLSSEYPDAVLLIAGEGPLASDLKDQADKKVSRERIRFFGRVDNIAELLRMSDVYVCSSEFESLGISLIEAMATGLVCVSTLSAGPADIIENTINGFLTEHRSQAISHALKVSFRLTQSERNSIAQAARKTILERFNVDQSTKTLLEAVGVPYKS